MFDWKEFWGNNYIDLCIEIHKLIPPHYRLNSGYHKCLDNVPEIKLSTPIIEMFGYIIIE